MTRSRRAAAGVRAAADTAAAPAAPAAQETVLDASLPVMKRARVDVSGGTDQTRRDVWLPDELWLMILRLLDRKKDIFALRGVNRQLQRVAFSIRKERYPAEKAWRKEHDLPLNALWVIQNLDQVAYDDSEDIFKLSLTERIMSPALLREIDAALGSPGAVGKVCIVTTLEQHVPKAFENLHQHDLKHIYGIELWCVNASNSYRQACITFFLYQKRWKEERSLI